MALFLLLQNEPPRQSHAEPVDLNKQTVHQAETKPAVSPQPQPEVQVAVAQVTPPEPVNTIPLGVLPCEAFRPLLAKYEWNVEVAMRVMDAESIGGYDGNCNTAAVGDTRVIGGIYAPSCGLFQVRTLPGRPSCEELQNPETNIAWAYRLWSGRPNWTDWSVCNNHIVRCY